MKPIVEGHAINTYSFCPRRCYYEYIEHVFYHNEYTIAGKLLHGHVDQIGLEKRGERELSRSLYLSSEKLGLSVRCDVVEEAQGKIYPVEYKRGKLADWENNFLQLCAQGIILEENLGLSISFGYLFFYGSHHRQKVMFTDPLREKTLDVIEKIRQLHAERKAPKGIDDWKKCKKCSLVDYCLPKERMQLKGKIPWEHFI
jgi:CRISPR-associated exonuclease Cas4